MARTANPKLGARRRRQILRAAAGCFTQKGFHQTTMLDICEAAEMSAGGLYRYFRTKDDIVVAIAEEERLENEAMMEVLRTCKDPVSALTGMTSAVLKAFTDPEYGPLAVETLAEATRNPRVNQALRRNEDELTLAIERALSQGQSEERVNRDFSARQLATMVMMLYSGLASRGILDPEYAPSAYTALANRVLEGLLRP